MSRKRCEMTTGGKRCPRYAMTAISKFCEQCAAPRKTIGQQMQDEADARTRAREDAKRELLDCLDKLAAQLDDLGLGSEQGMSMRLTRRAIEIAKAL